MLTRLRVRGFKNLIDTEVHFGPFTCIAGVNGTGKSNLFDALSFLSALAEKPLLDAAMSIRDEDGRSGDVQGLFHRVGDTKAEEMFFEADMIVPREGVDDLGQPATASFTSLKYTLALRLQANDSHHSGDALAIVHEELEQLDAHVMEKRLGFPHETVWRNSVVKGQHASLSLISTFLREDGERMIRRYQEGESVRNSELLASTLPRTVLSVANASESPTMLMARREMQSWRLLQLEPSSLRRPDSFTSTSRLGADGAHLPATLFRLANEASKGERDELRVYASVTEQLSNLIDEVSELRIDRDEKRELLTLEVKDRSGTVYPARSLSDGTLRFLALSVLDADPSVHGVICLEEPENGIHPSRLDAMLELLQGIAVDVTEACDEDNPLRQVIVNTHSPAVVQLIPEDTLLVSELKDWSVRGQRCRGVVFKSLENTWRSRLPHDGESEETEMDAEEKSLSVATQPFGSDRDSVSLIHLLSYLNPTLPTSTDDVDLKPKEKRPKRVMERKDLQLALFPQERFAHE